MSYHRRPRSLLAFQAALPDYSAAWVISIVRLHGLSRRPSNELDAPSHLITPAEAAAPPSRGVMVWTCQPATGWVVAARLAAAAVSITIYAPPVMSRQYSGCSASRPLLALHVDREPHHHMIARNGWPAGNNSLTIRHPPPNNIRRVEVDYDDAAEDMDYG
eukprot:scaffold14948_cov18-Prasinocladus_malaysianus.AAC.1